MKENSLLNKPITDELLLISSNKEEFIWSISVRPIGSLEGLFVWKVVDITSQRNFENEISRERELIFDLLDNLPVGFFSADQNGKFQYLNQTLASWLNIDSGFQESGERVSLSEFLAIEQTGKLDSAVEVDSSGMHAGLNLRGGEGSLKMKRLRVNLHTADLLYCGSHSPLLLMMAVGPSCLAESRGYSLILQLALLFLI